MARVDSSQGLIKKLRQILIKQRLVLFVSGLLTTAAAVTAAALVLSLVASLMILPVWLKISLLVATGATTIYFFARFALVRLFDGNIDRVAVTLEEKHPALNGRLIAAVQFERMSSSPGYSGELIELTLKQALQKASGINFNEAVTFHSILKTSRNFVIAAVVAVVMLLALPGLFSYSYEVYSHPTTEIAPPLGYKLVAVPGSTEWIKYRDIRIGAVVLGDNFPEEATIYHRLAGGSWQQSAVDLSAIPRFVSDRGDSLSFEITLRQISRSFDFYVEAGRVRTEVQQVNVVDRPRVTAIKLSVFYPSYTSLPPAVIDENNGSVSAVVGSRANLQIGTNLPVETAALVFADSSRTPITVQGKSGEVSLVIDSSRSYHIHLVDHLGEKNPDPIEFYLTAIPDEYPSIEVLRPGFDVNLGDDMILPLMVRIFDDFGFSSLVLKYTTVRSGHQSDEHVAVLHYSEKIKTEGEIEFSWDLDQLNLFPGDYIAYYLEVADNDRISGPKITKSRHYIARLPSLDEIVAEAEGESAKRIVRTEELLKTAKEVLQRLESSARKIESQNKTVKKADWQQQKEIKAALDKNSDMLKKIQRNAEQMSKQIDKMQNDAMLSREIMEKLAQLQKLYQEVATPEMKEAQRKLLEAMKKMDRKQLQKAMKDFQMTQQELLDRLERTLALLKKLQVEQKMEAMLRKIEQLAKQQEKMNQSTEASSKKSLPSLSQKEDKLKSSLDDLKAEVDDLNKLMKDAGMDQVPEAQKFSEALKKTDADQNMSQMSQAMQQQQKDKASKQGKKAQSKLLEMLDQMQRQLMAMRGNQDSETERALRVAIDDSNYLSRNQEDLMMQAATLDPRSLLVRDMAATQQDLISSCSGLKNRLSELGKKSPFLAAELGRLVDLATENMQLATSDFDNKNSPRAQRGQREAMVQLNKASIRLMESLEQQKNCKKGGSCSKPMSKLQSMCNKQNKLNLKTKSQCNNPGDGIPKPSQSGRPQLQRLAGEQASIRKSLEELNAEFGDSRQILGRLDDIAKEMKKVEEDLENGETGSEVTERQLKIHSRMLEAARSLQRRDYSEQRKAAVGDSRLFSIPQELSDDILRDRTNFEDKLRRYLSADYPPQYEQQIKAYFKALLKAESNSNFGSPQNW